jgi:predicted phosphodiesterase
MFVGDSHGDLMYLRQQLNRAEQWGLDLVFVMGDFGYWEHTKEGEHFLNRLDFWCGRHDTPLYFIDGNHDKTSLLLEKYGNNVGPDGFLEVREWVHYAPRFLQWAWDDKKFVALGGAYSIDKGRRIASERKRGKPESLWFPEEEITDDEMFDFISGNPGAVHIMLAHDKPRASNPKWNRKDILECHFNQNRLQWAVNEMQPELYIHGHLHYRYSDTIMTGDQDYCRVEGLDCNRDTEHGGDTEWTIAGTRLVIDLKKELEGQWTQQPS